MANTTMLAPEQRPAPQSLKDVIDVIPESCYRRSTLRGLSQAARDTVAYLAVLTALVFVDAWWLVLPLWALAGLVVSGLFVLGHDAAHESLFDNKRLNAVMGRLLFLPSLHLYGAWKLGHNHIHHRHTARQGMDFVWHPVTPDEWAEMGRLARLRHRLEWSVLGAGVYYLTHIWWAKMVRLSPPRRWQGELRTDRIVTGTSLVVAFAISGLLGGLYSGDVLGALWMFTKLVIGPFLAFCWFIGWTVYVHHIHERLPWARRGEWTKVHAQVQSTAVFRMPKVLDLFLHRIFVHVPHHVDTRIPNYHLSTAAAAIGEAYPDQMLDERWRVRDYVRTTRECKLFDFETGTWQRYP